MSEQLPGVDDDVRDLLVVYALDAVDDMDRRRVERLLTSDPEAQRTVDQFREVVASFSADTPPPTELRAQVFAALAPTEAHRRGPSAHQRSRPPRWRGLAVAAAIVIGVGVPTTVAVQSRITQNQVQAEADQISEMVADPAARLLTASMADGGDVTALLSGDHALFSATGMAALGADQDYQLWTIAGENISPAGLLNPADGTVSELLQVDSGMTLAVTVEPRGGSEQPTSDPIVALET